MRCVPVLLEYYKKYNVIPELFARGFAAYILFMRPVKNEGGTYFGKLLGKEYVLTDDKAAWFFDVWSNGTVDTVLRQVLQNEDLWGINLLFVPGFLEAVKDNMDELTAKGINHVLL